MILLCHFIYSVTYSVYVVLLYNTLCKPQEWAEEVADLDYIGRWRLMKECDLADNSNHWAVNYTIASWILLMIFTLIYSVKETTKYFHLRKR